MDDPAQSGEQLKAGTGCDPTPLTANNDQDGDGFLIRQDNCPLVANLAAQTGVPLCTLVSDIFGRRSLRAGDELERGRARSLLGRLSALAPPTVAGTGKPDS